MESAIYDEDAVNLKSLIQCVHEIQKVDEQNQHFYVEVVRHLSEFVVYGEKYHNVYFDVFCEKNTLDAFSHALSFNNRFLNMQLIQTTAILLQNVDTVTKRYYILSHPFVNKLISFNFNFYDEELVDIYISFVKSLALTINEETIQFFFNARFNHFPLFLIAIKFYNHPETMVRNAVKIIAMTLFGMNSPKINALLQDLPFCSYFSHMASFFKEKIMEIDLAYTS